MPRYIDVDAVRLAKNPYDEELSEYERGWNAACDAIAADAPTADVRENVHAHWEEADKYGNRRCSNCKSLEHVPTLMGKPIVWEFCPNCGAEMGERREDE